MASVHDVAKYILEQRRGPITTMKLQKLCYYSQAWHLVWDEEPLFHEKIEAWANGPVVRELFNAHRGEFSVTDWPLGASARLNASQKGTIDAVLEAYGSLSGRQLSALTHGEGPWRDAREGLGPTDRSERVIELGALAVYYGALDQSETATNVADLDWDSWA